jgi:hypothetical protein
MRDLVSSETRDLEHSLFCPRQRDAETRQAPCLATLENLSIQLFKTIQHFYFLGEQKGLHAWECVQVKSVSVLESESFKPGREPVAIVPLQLPVERTEISESSFVVTYPAMPSHNFLVERRKPIGGDRM